jgi:hypothetical protein
MDPQRDTGVTEALSLHITSADPSLAYVAAAQRVSADVSTAEGFVDHFLAPNAHDRIRPTTNSRTDNHDTCDSRTSADERIATLGGQPHAEPVGNAAESSAEAIAEPPRSGAVGAQR